MDQAFQGPHALVRGGLVAVLTEFGGLGCRAPSRGAPVSWFQCWARRGDAFSQQYKQTRYTQLRKHRQSSHLPQRRCSSARTLIVPATDKADCWGPGTRSVRCSGLLRRSEGIAAQHAAAVLTEKVPAGSGEQQGGHKAVAQQHRWAADLRAEEVPAGSSTLQEPRTGECTLFGFKRSRVWEGELAPLVHKLACWTRHDLF